MNKQTAKLLSHLLSFSSTTKGLLLGAWRSSVSGQGLEVKEVRPFAPGDNPLAAVWSRFAQTGALFTKVFQEERERGVYLALDKSGSLFQGRGKKIPFAEELFSLIAWAGIESRDSVGAIINRKESIKVIRPKSGETQLMLLLEEAFRRESLPITSSLSSFFINEKEAHGFKRSLLFYISDFIDTSTDWKKLFLSLSLHHEVVLLRLHHPKEDEELVQAIGLPCFDPEKRAPLTTLTKDMYAKRREILFRQRVALDEAVSALHLPIFTLDVQKPCLSQLIEVLTKRKK